MPDSLANASTTPARIRLNIGLTAHRDLITEETPRLRSEVRDFFLRVRGEFPDLPLRLISALAEGGDQLVAEEALALGIELVVPLPMPQAEYERDFEREGSLERFRGLLAQAQVRTLPMAPGNTPEEIQQRGPARNRQYAQLGMFVSSHCQILLALWDGKASEATGGTAQVVDYHLRNAMPGFSAEDVAPNLLADDESDLVYHLYCPRRLPHPEDGPGEPIEHLRDPRWVTVEGHLPGSSKVPAQYCHVFGQMQAFNRDTQRHANAMASEVRSLLDAGMPTPAPAPVREVDKLFGAADWLAVHFRRRVRRNMLLTHAMAAAMGLSFILYSDVDSDRRYVAAFLVLFALGWLVSLIGERREWHRKYLDYRGLAEGLRVQLYWRLAGVETPPNSSLGYDSFLQKQDVDLSWIRHAMRSSGLLRSEDFRPDQDWLRWVISRWVGERSAIDNDSSGQLAYFNAGSQSRERAYRTTALLGNIALAGGVLGAVALLLAGGHINPAWQKTLLVSMGLLPLLAGIHEAYSHKNADKELIKQFRFMSRLFDSCRARLDNARDDAESRHLLRALGCACLEEHAEWILLHRERPLEAGGLSG
ncbi:hypothetical protein [Thermomonas sp. HDW16]|uniref:hypothetical protein n=1 Tax=Thermomonas sp. HDW16 TaxID=2714945 RepID=UPI00140817EA|nr:hypothetical protein [Thermomonas sp. HDW16]QIL19978.1 hypothetical protein G7079_04100 [Thermomonas sp. HDW16]